MITNYFVLKLDVSRLDVMYISTAHMLESVYIFMSEFGPSHHHTTGDGVGMNMAAPTRSPSLVVYMTEEAGFAHGFVDRSCELQICT